MIYTIPLLMLIVGCWNYDRSNKPKMGLGLWILIYIFLVLMMGLRYKVGADTYNYIVYFSGAPDLKYWEPFDFSGFEPGFSLLTSAIKTLSDNVYVYQTIIASAMTFMLMAFIKRSTEYKFLGMLLVYIAMYPYFSTEVVRESLVVGGFLLAYPLLNKKRYVVYYSICLLLLSIHSSASLCFLMPLFKNLRFNNKFIVYIFFVLVTGFLLPLLMERLAGNYIFHKLLRYNKQVYVGYAWCGLRFLYFSLLPMFCLYLCKNRFQLKCKYENMICLQILLGFGIWFVPIVFQRFMNYTIVFYLVALADIIGTIFRDWNYRCQIPMISWEGKARLAKILLVLTIFAHSTYYIHLNFYEIYIPYHSMFDPIDEPMREKYVAGQD